MKQVTRETFNMTIETKDLGNAGEEIAEEYLIRGGYAVLDRNYRTKIGEIDIIAQKNGIICFVEVKTGTPKSTVYFLPEFHVDHRKFSKLKKLGELYLLERDLNKIDQKWRIDVISVIFDEYGNHKINHFENVIL
ncbi:MAG: YraN family protein [bacterium]|nr:YraN family protein [bacterium]